jgi:hypothetical protein
MYIYICAYIYVYLGWLSGWARTHVLRVAGPGKNYVATPLQSPFLLNRYADLIPNPYTLNPAT